MAYNKQTALENQKAFLRSQAKCGYPNIEKRAKETLKKIEENERKQAELNIRIRIFNEKWSQERSKGKK